MIAVADQVQVAGFVVIAIFAIGFLLGLLLLATACWLEWRDRMDARAAKRARIVEHEARRHERLAATNGRPLTSAVDTSDRWAA